MSLLQKKNKKLLNLFLCMYTVVKMVSKIERSFTTKCWSMCVRSIQKCW